MVIISRTVINKYGSIHPKAKEPLQDWYNKTRKADWKNLTDLKNTFNSVDFVGNNRYVFNIRKNNYRLVAVIHFDVRTLYVRFIGTHADYDKIDATTI